MKDIVLGIRKALKRRVDIDDERPSGLNSISWKMGNQIKLSVLVASFKDWNVRLDECTGGGKPGKEDDSHVGREEDLQLKRLDHDSGHKLF